MHYLSRTILNVPYAVRSSQCILIFQQFLNTKEEVKRGKYVEREIGQVHVCQSPQKSM